MESRPKLKLLESERMFSGRVIALRQDRFQAADGSELLREVVEHPGAVVMVALTARDEVLLVRQYRHAAGEELLELPAGTLELGEDPEETAARELQEEVGFRPERLTLLGSFYSAPGFCDELLYCYLAERLVPSELDGDPDESIERVAMPLAEAVHAAATGRIKDAKTLAGLLLAAQRRGLLG